jgi:hypothetical protein
MISAPRPGAQGRIFYKVNNPGTTTPYINVGEEGAQTATRAVKIKQAIALLPRTKITTA